MMKCELPTHLTSIEEFKKSVASALSLEEKAFIEGIKEENFLKNFYTIWCAKESYLKALGIGLLKNASDLTIYFSANGSIRLKNCENVSFYSVETIPNFICIVCLIFEESEPPSLDYFVEIKLCNSLIESCLLQDEYKNILYSKPLKKK